MSEVRNVILEGVGSPVVTLTLNRPHVHNAFDDVTINEMIEAAGVVGSDPIAKVLILRGSGTKAFSTGSDLGEAFDADLDLHRYHWRIGHRMMNAIEDLPQATIASIHGFALGGGCELALACDIRLAASTAEIGLAEIKIGAIPACGGTQRLPRLIGAGKALELIMTGDRIPASEALRIGLVNRVFEADQLDAATRAFADHLASMGRRSLQAAKSLVYASFTVDRQRGEELESLHCADCVAEPDFRERVGAFLNGRRS